MFNRMIVSVYEWELSKILEKIIFAYTDVGEGRSQDTVASP